jgi:hypothetical protein
MTIAVTAVSGQLAVLLRKRFDMKLDRLSVWPAPAESHRAWDRRAPGGTTGPTRMI